MPLPSAPFLRATLGGDVAGGADIWRCRINMSLSGSLGAPTAAEMSDIANLMFTAAVAAITDSAHDLRPFMADGTSLAFASAAFYNAGVLVNAGDYVPTTPTQGTSTTRLPSYTALCVTLLTDVGGRSGRGRSYLPCDGQPVGTAGVWSSIVNAAYASAWAAVLTGLNADYTAGASTATATAGVLSLKYGFISDVVSVRADNLPDTQRGRINKIAPTNTASATVGT